MFVASRIPNYVIIDYRIIRNEIIIEPAEPEPPAAHSIGRVGEDAMGRSGQIVKPCWLAAGGVALVVRNWLVVRLVFRYFSDIAPFHLLLLSNELINAVHQCQTL